jgi:hemerythrin-like metal-binding protein
VEDWEPASLGDERLDVQRRHLLRRLRRLGVAVAGGKLDEVRSSLRLLSLSLAEHWRDEERWMEESGYPGISDHARRHSALLAQLADVFEPRARLNLLRAAADLADALEGHMRSEDLRLERFFAARANFRAMAEAGPGKGPTLTPIPGAPTAGATSPVRTSPPAPLPGESKQKG